MLGVRTSLHLAMRYLIYSERFMPSFFALRSICLSSLSVSQNLILSVLFSMITIFPFGVLGVRIATPNKCVCGVCTQTRCLLMQCHLLMPFQYNQFSSSPYINLGIIKDRLFSRSSFAYVAVKFLFHRHSAIRGKVFTRVKMFLFLPYTVQG